MRVVITGGSGFLGRRLTDVLLARGELTDAHGKPSSIDEVIWLDPFAPEEPVAGLDPRVKIVRADIADAGAMREAIAGNVSVFHLASVVSGGAEQDFDGALRTNLDGTRNVLEACRAADGVPRLVFPSSSAIYGGSTTPEVANDLTKPTPENTYGVTKAISELLINDYTRKGFLDGRTARLAMIIVRPGKPNAAASGFSSGIIREPLAGQPCVVPVPLDTRIAIMGYRQCVQGFVALHEVDGAALGADRALNMPNLDVSLSEMVSALKKVAAAHGRALGEIQVQPEERIMRIISSLPRRIEHQRASALKLPADESIERVIEDYVEDYALS